MSKIYIKYLFPILLLCLAIGWTSCNNDDDQPMPTPGKVEIILNTSAFEESRGKSVDIPVSLTAEDGVKSLSVSVEGGAAEDIAVTSGSSSQTITYTFEIPGNTILDKSFSLAFTLTDQNAATANATATIKTIASISVPASYAFMRNGQSTVSRSGQTDRLNMVEEIKNNILKEGDKGNIISEQTLLDAFENANGDGNGFFSFTSSKQLKNKTFQPDLDNRLFEDLFSSAATASVAASGGAIAANGTAGLLTRENSGKTVLVDENGREFTQLIEKGLMGAVFYNQIYNVYLTDARTGDDVENTDLSESKNYTPMEHHWDEAFGYWDPPLDFTSPWPSERGSEDRFWSHYSNVVDNVNNGQLGTNKILMDAYKTGRTAIVNNDLATKNVQREVLYENLELVAAATAVHYINSTLAALNDGKTGEAFHVLSEAWAFTNALKYSPDRKITLAQIEEIMETDFGANGNFWNVTSDGLNKAKSTLVGAYTKLAPVKDDL